MLQLEWEKKMKKNGFTCLVSMFPSWVMLLKLSKNVHFVQFCADLSKNLSVKPIYIYASESSHYTLSENDLLYGSLSYRSWDISN